MALVVITSTGTSAGSSAQNQTAMTFTIPSLAIGDVVVVAAGTWDQANTLSPPSGTGLSFTQQSAPNNPSKARAYIWTAVATVAGTNVVVTCNVLAASNSQHNGVLYLCPTADGYSLAATPNIISDASGAGVGTGALAGTTGNLGIVVSIDWSGKTGTITFSAGEIADQTMQSAGNSSHYFGHGPLTGPTTTVGVSTPAAGTYTIAAIEVLLAGGAAVVSEYAAPWKQQPPGRLSPGSRMWNPAPGVATTAAAPAALAGNQSEAVAIGDATSARVTLARAVPETLTAADTTARAVAVPRAAAETLTVADVVTRAGSDARAQAETVAAADTTARALTTPRTAAETVVVAEVVARSAQSLARATTETVTAADTIGQANTRARATAETVTLADTVARTSSRSRALAETVTATETVTRSVSQARSEAEALGVTDTTSTGAGANLSRSQAETLTAGDATSRGLALPRPVADQVTTADTCARGSSRARAVTDSVTATDATARAVTRSRASSETVTATDATVRQVGLPRTIGEPLALTDLAQTASTRARALLEALLLVDATTGVVVNPSGFRDITIVAELDGCRLAASVTRTRGADLVVRRELLAQVDQPQRTATLTRPWKATT